MIFDTHAHYDDHLHLDTPSNQRPLSALGIEQVAKLRKTLNADTRRFGLPHERLVYVSTMRRAQDTAEGLSTSSIILLDDLRMAEHPSLEMWEVMDTFMKKIWEGAECRGKNFVIVISHGSFPTALAEFTSTHITGENVWKTLNPSTPPHAAGYHVDMATGDITHVK